MCGSWYNERLRVMTTLLISVDGCQKKPPTVIKDGGV